ncbi:hypothetical protein Clacol_005089 [Clathrus columnatus]|uniref:Alginate lyase domain-containing protein n=1 Tax=Clathrus columnatus TaxID=1419009 RepID=A0AAV5A8A6_9AGAM|nr:hypothetical protein Clacol_005089 [Clathrus columnatus]
MLITFVTSFLFLFLQLVVPTRGETPPLASYDSIFLDPNYIVNGNFPSTTWQAKDTIVQWAEDLVSLGPWSVMNKSVTPPSGDKHDYMSWAIYWWPDCSNVRNTTLLPPEQVWTECTYVQRDGDINPDVRTVVDDVGSFANLSDAVLYNTLAWSLNKDNDSASVYSQRTVNYINTWFLNNATKMNPNLNYAQMHRGPTGQMGTKTGVLDAHPITKIVSSILIMRMENNTDWTDDMHNQFVSWSNQYVQWLETAKIAIQESEATNNHGTYYYGQLAALKLLVGDMDGAKNATETYFNNQFQQQINATGEQKHQELGRIITDSIIWRRWLYTNAQILSYLDPSSNAWNKTTAYGATIQTALDFILTLNPSASNESDQPSEFYVDVAAVAAVYGDPTHKYTSFLSSGDPNYAAQAYFLWTQPLAGGTPPPSNSTSSRKNGGFAVVPAADSKVISIFSNLLADQLEGQTAAA